MLSPEERKIYKLKEGDVINIEIKKERKGK